MRFIILFFLFSNFSVAQISPDCVTAIPICSNTPVNSGIDSYGVDDFNNAAASGCLERTASGAIESNSAWYRFRTSATGQLGFNISTDVNEDWDFALYKTDDCANLGAPVRCNFLDNGDQNNFLGVGEDPTGVTDNIQYEDWLSVVPGEEYYLLINNFSNINSGFSVQFSGAIFETNPYDALDCSIINNLLGPPIAACESDFVELDATTVGALSYEWYRNDGSGYSQIIGEVSASLIVLNSSDYRVVVRESAGNIISDVQVSFTPNPSASSIQDNYFCFDDVAFDLSSVNSEVLGAQDSNAFLVTYHETFTDAVTGANSLENSHVKSAGTETIYVRVSSFANPKCYDASQDFQLVVSDPILQNFPETVYLCEAISSAIIGDDTPNSNFTYLWSTGENTATIAVATAGSYEVTISTTVGALTCSEVFNTTLVISKSPNITTVAIDDLQADNSVVVSTELDGDYEYQLDDEPFQTSSQFNNVLPGMHTVTVNDLEGCGMDSETFVVVGFTRFFSPNGDGINDVWGVEGLETLDSPILLIFDRYGKLLQQLDIFKTEWDGLYNGIQMPASDYWFQLSYLETDGSRVVAKYINNHFSLKR
ncbi:T9SS type B sorting domain-containing protein [Cellulophaga sp. L1A9]|uniref:T9SS type B sorting domain-containing protein n=1 Tax=Cellulophaga sp. L1A9 TaxID=2686362 RepID=UPI00131AE468|nr:T9SS type B sorting domain-containing protein [Cellulophaga sp. L1A9]